MRETVKFSAASKLFALVPALLALPLSASASPNLDPAALTIVLESSHRSISANERTIYLKVRVKPASVVAPARSPLALALVFDRSGSMNEEGKLGYLKKAAHLLVDNLTGSDHASLTAFGDDVVTLVPMHRLVHRDYLHHRIDELFARGWTNLSGGLLAGCHELSKAKDASGRRHLILFTDGLANRGVIDPDGLVRLVEGCASEDTTITTIGLGAEYDEQVLARMAKKGGGRYVYVAKAEQIPGALHRELGELLDVVAQNVKLFVEAPAGAGVEEVFSRFDRHAPSSHAISLGDLTADDERVVLLRLHLDGELPPGPVSLRARLEYDDIGRKRHERAAHQIGIARSGSGSATVDAVLAYAQLAEALDKISLAVEGGDLDLAREVLELEHGQFPSLEKIARASQDQDFINRAFLFAHYSRELAELLKTGKLHDHREQREAKKKDLHYRRYLLEHHQADHDHD